MQRQINQEHHHQQLETIWFSGYTIQNPSVCHEKCTTVCAFQHHLACNLNRKSEFCAHKTNWVSIISCGAAAVKNRVWQNIFILMNCQGCLEQGWVRTPALENSIKNIWLISQNSMRWTFALKSFPGALPTHNVGMAFSFSGIVLQNTTTASCTPFGLSVLGHDATTGLIWWLKLDGDACFFPTTTKPVRMDVIAWWCCAVSCNFSNLGCMWEFLQTPVKCHSIYVSLSQVWCVFEDLVYTLQLMKLLIQTCQTGSIKSKSIKMWEACLFSTSNFQSSIWATCCSRCNTKGILCIMAACCRTNILHNSMAFEMTSFFLHVHNPSEMCQGEKMCTAHYGHRTNQYIGTKFQFGD